jgi:hypothetical protein
MKTMFKVQTYSNKVEPVDVVKETDKTVLIKEVSRAGLPYEVRIAKEGRYHKVCETWAEGRSWIINRLEYQVRSAQANLDRCQKDLDEALAALPEPSLS